MSEYIRATRECSVSQFHPVLLQALREHFQEHQLGNLEAETLLCCETVSRKKSTSTLISWLNGKPDTTIYTGMLLTSQWLIWVHHGDQSRTLLNAAKLSHIRVEYVYFPLMKDAGMEVVGYIGDANLRVKGHIMMGSGLAAQKFCEEVKQAITSANPPTQKELFKWLAR